MAHYYYGLDRGQTEFQIVEGNNTSTTKGIEVAIDLSQSFQKGEVLEKLEELYDYILAHNWPPA